MEGRSRGARPATSGHSRFTASTRVETNTLVITGAVLSFATILAVSRQLGQPGAGDFIQVMAFFSIALVAACLGADVALVRYVGAALAAGRPSDVRALLRVSLIPVCFSSGLFASAILLGGPLWEGGSPSSGSARLSESVHR